MKQGEKVALYAISVDPPEVSRSFAEKIASDGKGKVAFPLLSDPENKIIDAYGLRDPAYEGQKVYGIPHPAVYVINKDGKVSWAKIESNYRVRPSNQEIRAALDRLTAAGNQAICLGPSASEITITLIHVVLNSSSSPRCDWQREG